MPVNYKPSKFAFFTEGESLTEQEHKDSCDINKMMRNLHRGLDVRTKNTGPWAEGVVDDLTIDATQFRIQKAKVEEDLAKTAQETEFTESELKLIPEAVKKKFKFKSKKAQEPKNDQTKPKEEPKKDDIKDPS